MTALIRHLLAQESLRFVLTGGGAAILYYVLCLGFTLVLRSPFWAALLAYAVAFAVAYTIQQSWTFRGRHNHRGSFPRYLAAQVTAACVASGVATLAGRAGLAPGVLALAATLSGSAVSYVLARYWVFSHKRARADAGR